MQQELLDRSGLSDEANKERAIDNVEGAKSDRGEEKAIDSASHSDERNSVGENVTQAVPPPHDGCGGLSRRISFRLYSVSYLVFAVSFRIDLSSPHAMHPRPAARTWPALPE